MVYIFKNKCHKSNSNWIGSIHHTHRKTKRKDVAEFEEQDIRDGIMIQEYKN